MIIRTMPYKVSEIEQIIKLRAQTEGLSVDDEAVTALSQIGNDTTLRYAVQLMTPAFQSAKVNGRSQIIKDDILEINGLFLDAKRSSKFLTESSKFMK